MNLVRTVWESLLKLTPQGGRKNKMATLHKNNWVKLLALIGGIFTGGSVVVTGNVTEGIGIILASVSSVSAVLGGTR